jgi:predicted transcriptional regulator
VTNILAVPENSENDMLEDIPFYPDTITEKKLEITGYKRSTIRNYLMNLMKEKKVECNDTGRAYQYYRPKEETF